MSINWEKSAELNGCTVEELKARFKRFPGSNKKIIAVCEGIECNNRERKMSFRYYHDLCHSCAMKKRFEDPKERKKSSEASKKAYIEDPTISQRMSESQKRRWDDPEEQKKMSDAHKKSYRNNQIAHKNYQN